MNEYEKFGYGIFIVKSENSNFNADFSGSPRRLPDEKGTIYATDKALKYCIRRYLNDFGHKVFAWRRLNDKQKPCTIKENYKKIFSEDPKDKLEIIKNLISCEDVKFFGVTYAEGGEDTKSISFTGPIQISYGINKYPLNINYSNQILGPFASKEKKEKSTIGSESNSLQSWYVYDIIVNPNNINKELEQYNENFQGLSNNDIKLFKEALCRGVTYTNSCSKIGSESVFFIYLETEKAVILPSLKEIIKLEKQENKMIINLSKLNKILSDYNNEFNISIYYNPYVLEIKEAPNNSEKLNINTLNKIKEN